MTGHLSHELADATTENDKEGELLFNRVQAMMRIREVEQSLRRNGSAKSHR